MSTLHESASPIGPLAKDWRLARVEDLTVKVGSGATPTGGKQSYLAERSNFALVRSQNVFDRRLAMDGLAFVTDEAAAKLKIVHLQERDVLLNITGDGVTFARACLVPRHILPACVNQHVSILRTDHRRCDPGFLVSYLVHPLTKKYIESFNTGGSRRAITKAHILSFQVPLPPLATQRKIASALGAYDELIENNRRRIEILEEMARRLYREWFVQFRFPGHAHVPLTDSPLGKIPKGWEVKTLDELCVQPNGIQTGPFGSQLHQSDYTDAGIPVVMPKDIIDSRVSVETIARVPQSICDKLAKHKLEPGDIVLARRGDIGRRSFVTRRQIGWMCGTGCMRLRPAPSVVLPRFLFDAVGSPENIGLIASRAAGAIMPNLNGQVLASIPIVIPPRNVQERYCGIVEPIFELIAGLFDRNANLQTTRDLLLPRLISGELDVSELPIEVEEAARDDE